MDKNLDVKRRSKRSRSEDSNDEHYDRRRGMEGNRDRDREREGHRSRESNERRDRDDDRYGHSHRHRSRERHFRRDRDEERYCHQERDDDHRRHHHREVEHHHREDDYSRHHDNKDLYRGDDGRSYHRYDHRYESRCSYPYEDHHRQVRHDKNRHSNRDEEGHNWDRKVVEGNRPSKGEVKGGDGKSEESTCLVLDNVFDKTVKDNDEEYFLDIEDHIQERCAQFGPVEHIHAHKYSGLVYLRFGTPRIAALAQKGLHGSTFEVTGRTMTATFVPKKLYISKFPTKWGQCL